MENKYNDLLSFIISEKILTITVICSIITFQFISTFKTNIADPLFDFLLPEEKFDFLNVTIRDGQEIPKLENKKLVIDFGQVFKELAKFIFGITIMLLLAKYVKVPDTPGGNPGVAIM